MKIKITAKNIMPDDEDYSTVPFTDCPDECEELLARLAMEEWE
jgi:hypothetical protein